MMLSASMVSIFVCAYIYVRNKKAINEGTLGWQKQGLWFMSFVVGLGIFVIGLAEFLCGQLPLPKGQESLMFFLGLSMVMYSSVSLYLAELLHNFLNRS